jgi:hypothetical protein
LDTSSLAFTIDIQDDNAEESRLDEMTMRLMHDLREMGADSVEKRSSTMPPEKGTKGDPFTIGALALVVAPVVIPGLIDYLKSWAIDGRSVRIKTTDGLEVEFSPKKKMSSEEVISLAEKLSQIKS